MATTQAVHFDVAGGHVEHGHDVSDGKKHIPDANARLPYSGYVYMYTAKQDRSSRGYPEVTITPDLSRVVNNHKGKKTPSLR